MSLPVVALKADHVVFVLSAFEQQHFFPGGLEYIQRMLPGAICIEPRQILDWAIFFRQHKTDVLLGCWNMPPLPPFNAIDAGTAPRYICYIAGSVRNAIPRDWIENSVLVSNWGNRISHIVAEGALMLILGTLRQVPANHENLHHAGGWRRPERDEWSLFGRTVGIHGFGQVAQALVRLLNPFGVNIQTYAPGTPTACFEAHPHVVRCSTIDELFATSDVLVEAAPLNENTVGVVDKQLLSLLPQQASFINVGRGAIVCENALLEVAEKRGLRVGLDVYAHEPLPVDSPLRRKNNFLLMPHQAGPTLDRYVDAGEFAMQQVADWLNGKSPTAIVGIREWDQAT